jgi:hypothetical protein
MQKGLSGPHCQYNVAVLMRHPFRRYPEVHRMDHKIAIVIAVAVVVVGILILASVFTRKRRTDNLRKRFGPEYDRTVHEFGPERAESKLHEREKRVGKFSIRPLSVSERQHFLAEWRATQSRFVDDPRGAAEDADALVNKVMQSRGYPMSAFEQRADDVSVDHPRVVDNYRAAHEIAIRQRSGEATTEDLRSALIYYRSLFDDLLETTSTTEKEIA